jgi:hypothetical protein
MMVSKWVIAAVLAAVASSVHDPVSAQQRRKPPARKPVPPPPPKLEPAQVRCPESLGTGVRTKASYCFVLAGRDPAQGVIVAVPPHTGQAKLLFDLHNRHTYSEEEMKAGRGYARYSAVIGVLTADGKLVDRAAVQSEFRSARDLHERISGGAGPGGVKAVAPIGVEHVAIVLPAGVEQVSLLGELLDGVTAAGREVAGIGRPVALVSSVQIEYRPAPAKKR